MARSCGIRIGPRRYEIVVLDGSPKKHQISAYYAGEFPADAEDGIGEFAQLLREAAKTHNIPRENVGVVVDSGHAAFRRLTLPFTDMSKIEQVIKFEVEGELPQWNVDDVVVDPLILSQTDDECELLVSAVPKKELAEHLSLCEKAGIEPLEVELETTALINAASAADICTIDNAQLLVHVGDHSTSVVVMDGGQVRDMRVIHIGALSHEARRKQQLAEAEAEAAAALEEGEEVPEKELVLLENPEEPDHLDISRRIDQAIKRIRRELGRTISAARTVHPIESIYVCGMELPGLIGSSVQDVPIYLLDCFDEDGGRPADGYGALVVAYGAAVRQLGGGIVTGSLRREELRFTGAFERVEFPLAVACLLLATFLGVVCILQHREKQFLADGVQFWLASSNNYMVGDLEAGKVGALSPVPEELDQYVKMVDFEGDPGRTSLESLRYISGDLAGRVLALQRQLGQDGDVEQPQSAFVATTLVLSVLFSEEAWRPSLRKVRSTYQKGSQGRPDSVDVILDITFFAENSLIATKNYEDFEAALRDEPWFVKFEKKKSSTLDADKGISVVGLPVTVDVSKYYDALVPGASVGGV